MKVRMLPILVAAVLFAACGGGGSGGSGGTTTIDPPIAKEVVSRSFPVTEFTGVAINGSFAATVRHGSDFTVELTVEADVVNLLDVYLDGTVLQIGFVPGSDIRADTLEAVVTMPSLQSIELDGSNKVELRDFSGATIDIDLDGSNFLSAHNSAYDFMNARVNGNVLFEFVEVAALPVAHIDISGSSTATLNLMDFATLTGSVMGTSMLSYYGNGVNLDLNTTSSATVVHLGPSL